MELAAYLRVSTDRQAERGLGLDVQEQAIRRWVRAHKHKVGLWTRDEGVSGSNGLDSRVGLTDALTAIGSEVVQGLVVYRLDRLARDLVLQEQLIAEVKRLGGQLFSTSEAEGGFLDDDPDDPSRRMIRQVLGAVAEYERSMIALRLRSGRRRKAERGGFAYGAPPLGYRSEDRELVAIPEEQDTLRRMKELRAQGASLRDICTQLETEGRRTKRGGSRWHPPVVRAALGEANGAEGTSRPSFSCAPRSMPSPLGGR